MPSSSLVLPGILDLPTADLRAVFERSPLLTSLLAATRSGEKRDGDAWSWLCQALHVPRQDDWPLAPVWAAADGLPTGSEYWLVAAPIALEVGRIDVRLSTAHPVLQENDAQTLLDKLNAHFADDDLRFVRGRSGRWFAHLPPGAHITTHAPRALQGHALRDFLPQGPDAGQWRRWQNEIQMLIHGAHERSELHDEALAANAVWFWAGGTLPPANTATDVCVATDDDDVIALSVHTGAQLRKLCDFVPGLTEGGIAVLWEVDRPVPAGDPAVVLTGMKARTPADVDLVLTGATQTAVLRSRQGSLLQRWRRRVIRPDIGALMTMAEIEGAERN